MEWKGKAEYAAADRTVWRSGDDVCGFVRVVENFTQIVVRGAGHIVPFGA